jgi:dTDP-4-dehydrorhamnose 3,5-epimerase-like enzyme
VFIYILNLLNDGLRKKKNLCEREQLNVEIINDTWYISQFAGINRNFDIKIIKDRVIDIFKVLSKYQLSRQDIIGVLKKLIKNNNNIWILEYFYHGYNNIKDESELVLNSIISNIFESIYINRVEEKFGNVG